MCGSACGSACRACGYAVALARKAPESITGYALGLFLWAIALPEELVKQQEIDVNYQPGEVDIASEDWADDSVVSGWKLRRLDDEEYSKHRHEQLASGNCGYTITFAKDAPAICEKKKERRAKVQVSEVFLLG